MSLDTSHSSSTPRFPLLALGNYGSWVGNAKAWFMRQGLWGIVSGRSKRPVPADSKAPTAAETEGIEAWDDKAEKAAGELYLLVSEEQKVHFAGISDEPSKMWTKLETIHLQKRPGARFNAYDVLFSIHKFPDESLQALMGRVDKAMQIIKEFRPDFTDSPALYPRSTPPLHPHSRCSTSSKRRSSRKRLWQRNCSGTAPTTTEMHPLVRSLLQHWLPALPLPSLASSARSQVTPSPPAIATALPKSQQRRTQRTGPRSDAKIAPEVANAPPTAGLQASQHALPTTTLCILPVLGRCCC